MKKIVSLLISVWMIFNYSVSVAASGTDNLLLYCSETVFRRGIINDYNTQVTLDDDFVISDSYNYAYRIGSYEYNAYTTLSDTEKVLYNAMVTGLKNGKSSIRVDYSPVLTSADYKSIDFLKLLEAFGLDHPEYFYVTSLRHSYAAYSNGDVVYIILQPRSVSYYDSSVELYTSDEIPECAEQLQSIVESIDLKFSNRYEFVKVLHDYLCNSITYVNNYSRCHDAYGALVEGEAVCQGYADAFKLICDYYKIPAVCLTGTANGGAHMWNAVQMDDGLWYYFDVTWDDQGESGIFYDFFLVGGKTLDTYFGKSAFSESHISDGAPYLPSISYADEKYSQSLHNTAFKATYNSIAKNSERILIRSLFDAAVTNVYYNGLYVPVGILKTNSSFTVPSGTDGKNEIWTLALLGDCDGDGNAAVSDYSVAVNMVLSEKKIDDAYSTATDVNCDGVLNVIDLAIIEQLANGLVTVFTLE